MPLLCLLPITIERACITAVGRLQVVDIEGLPAGSTNETLSSVRDDGATAIAEALNTNTCIRKFRKVGTNRRHAKALADQRCVDLVVTQMPKSTMTVRPQSRRLSKQTRQC